MELVKQLGIEITNEDPEIPEWQKEIVLERMKNTKPEDYISWEEARKQLKFKDEKYLFTSKLGKTTSYKLLK